MKKCFSVTLLCMVFCITGCAVRTIPYEAERVDQELTGNRGVVGGDPSSLPQTERKKTKRMYNIEIELPSRFDRNKRGEKLNKGYISSKDVLEAKDRPASAVAVEAPSKTTSIVEVKTGTSKTSIENKKYIVQNGDTLQKISDKFYGTVKQWNKIYEANRAVMDSPDNIKPGMELIIPGETQWKK
ncbi:MAG: LysM peptidoglycan-binding domain-containing protein [Candidatus Omnitrophota bacterium]